MAYVPLHKNDTRAQTSPSRQPFRRARPKSVKLLHTNHAAGDAPLLQRKPIVGAAHDALEREADHISHRVVHAPNSHAKNALRPLSASAADPGEALDDATALAVTSPSGGKMLNHRVQQTLESHLGRDLSHVRMHQDPAAHEMAAGLRARAFTHKRHIWLGRGESADDLGLMAHEVTHVLQQGDSGGRVQRYESGEHAELGRTRDELKALIKSVHVVKAGETAESIAWDNDIEIGELKAVNEGSTWPPKPGQTIRIPLNELAAAALRGDAMTFTVNNVKLDYGVGMALPDFYETPDEIEQVSRMTEMAGGDSLMSQMPEPQLEKLATLIEGERDTGKLVELDEWERVTQGTFYKMATENAPHFAPSEIGAKDGNKAAWTNYHMAALNASMDGDKDRAWARNSFADHFLTDAFAAGHLINKSDTMKRLTNKLRKSGNGEYSPAFTAFFNGIAAGIFADPTARAGFAAYETATGGLNLDNTQSLALLLVNIAEERPDLFGNAAALEIHHILNELPGGLWVTNADGKPWQLSGDKTLNPETRDIARKAVAQSQHNVIAVFQRQTTPPYRDMLEKVWRYTPVLTEAGAGMVESTTAYETDITSANVRQKMVDLIVKNHPRIIQELSDLKHITRIRSQ